jgi:hypothetical protein
MVLPAPRAPSCLSYLIGPGPTAEDPRTHLRIGVANNGEAVEAVRVRLVLLSGARNAQPLAEAELGLLLPRRCGRELAATIDWSGRRLVLGRRSASFRSPPDDPGAGAHVVRAELLDGHDARADALEVGVRRSSDAGPPAADRA